MSATDRLTDRGNALGAACFCALALFIGACGASHKVGRAEALYKSLGGSDFVGADGGTDLASVYRWFDAHQEAADKFVGKGGVCNGYEPSPDIAQRERVVCAGASRVILERMMKH